MNLPDSDRGRLPNNIERYAALPAQTRKVIEDMRDEDAENFAMILKLMREKGGVQRIEAAIDLSESISRSGKFIRWGAATLIAIFAGMASIASGWQAVSGWFHGGKP